MWLTGGHLRLSPQPRDTDGSRIPRQLGGPAALRSPPRQGHGLGKAAKQPGGEPTRPAARLGGPGNGCHLGTGTAFAVCAEFSRHAKTVILGKRFRLLTLF